MFNTLLYSYLQFEWTDENPEPSTEKKCIQRVQQFLIECYFSNQDHLWSVTTQNL